MSNRAAAGLLRDSLAYSFSVIVQRAGHLLLLPFLLQGLSLTDFGIIGLCQSVAVFLMPVFELGVTYGIQRMYYHWKEIERKKYLSAISLSLLLSGVALTVFLLIFGKELFGLLIHSVPFSPYIQLMLLNTFFLSIHQIPISVFRITQGLKQYTIFSLLQFGCQCFFILYFVLVVNEGSKGYLLGMCISSGLLAIYSLFFILRNFSFPNQGRYFVEPFLFCLQMVPTGILDGLSTVVNRLVLEKFVNLELIGVYTLARQLGYVVGMLNQVLKQAYIPLTYKMVSLQQNFRNELAKLSVTYVSVISILGMAVFLLAGPLIEFFAKPEYIEVIKYIPFVVLACLIDSAGTAFGRGYDLAMKPNYFIYVTSWTLISNLLISYVMISNYKLIGAIYSLILCAIAKNTVHIYIAYKAYPRPTFVGPILKLSGIIMTAFFLTQYLIYSNQLNFFTALVFTVFFGGIIFLTNREFIPLNILKLK